MRTPRSLRRSIAAVVCALAVPTLASAQRSTSDEAAIRATRAAYNAAIAKHDVDAMAAYWASDYVSVSSRNARDLTRADAVAGFRQIIATRKDVVFVRTPTSIVVNAAWGQAGENGRWTGHWTTPEGEVKVGGIYFAKWVRREGKWLALSETFVQTACAGKSYCDAVP